MNRRIEHSKNSDRIFKGASGRRGRYRLASELAAQLAFAFRESDALRHQVTADRIPASRA